MPAPDRPVELSKQYPDPVVITAEEALFYAQVCEEYSDVGADKKAIYEKYGLTESAACGWVIFGHTVQGNLNIEDIFNQLTGYILLLEKHNKYLEATLESYRESVKRVEENL